MRSLDEPPELVICTIRENPRYIRELTGVGASAYLLESSSAEHLLAAVRAAVVVGMPRTMLERTEEMGVGSRGEAAREALLKGWISKEELAEPAAGEEG